MLNLQTDYVAVIDELLCTCSRGDCCRKCLRVCSTGGMMWVSSDRLLMIDPWACDGCGNCVTECPEGAVSLRPRRTS